MKNTILLLIFLLGCFSCNRSGQNPVLPPTEIQQTLAPCTSACHTISSPNQDIVLSLEFSDHIYYSVTFRGKLVLDKSLMTLDLGNEILGAQPILESVEKGVIQETLSPVVSLKNAEVPNHYSVAKYYFQKDFQIEFRVYDDGLSYRFHTQKEGEVKIFGEQAVFNFAKNYNTWTAPCSDFLTDYQEQYKDFRFSKMTDAHTFIIPILVEMGHGHRMIITEADLYDYPGMFLSGNADQSVRAVFPKYPLHTSPKNYGTLTISEEADYIASTSGTRSFPWRVLFLSKEDKELAQNEMVYKLSRPQQIKNTDWIKPGQSTWEWWHILKPHEEGFQKQLDTRDYKSYLDFAARYTISYLTIDEGWYQSPDDPFHPRADLDIHELIRYGQSKSVKIFLWLPWLTIEKNPQIFKTFSDWGVAGIKVDFMNRSDQWMINFYTRTAQEAAKHQLLLNFHGSTKPAGLRRAYPNVLAFEGMIGMESNLRIGRATASHNLILPFTRNAVGPMDYAPGALRSRHWKEWESDIKSPIGIGTRVHQIALFIVFESGLQTLVDNPLHYQKQSDCTSFITSIPVTWDETQILEARIRAYFLVAKRKGKEWFVGALTNEQERDLTINFDFLDKDQKYLLTAFEDGTDANQKATDYQMINQPIQYGDSLKINLKKEGGWVGRLIPQE